MLVPLPRTASRNPCSLMMTDYYSKQRRAVPILKTSTAHVTPIFYSHWIIQYGDTHLFVRRQQTTIHELILRNLLQYPWAEATHNNNISLQTNCQEKRYETLIMHFRHYVAEHQHVLNILVQALTYAYSSQISCSTCTTGIQHGSLEISTWPKYLLTHMTILKRR